MFDRLSRRLQRRSLTGDARIVKVSHEEAESYEPQGPGFLDEFCFDRGLHGHGCGADGPGSDGASSA
jgi:hypothetical protein